MQSIYFLVLAKKHWLLLVSSPKKKKKWNEEDISGNPVVKNLPANAGGMSSIPGPGRPHILQSN